MKNVTHSAFFISLQLQQEYWNNDNATADTTDFAAVAEDEATNSDNCGEGLEYAGGHTSSQSNATQIEKKRYACDLCEKSFNRRPNLSKHRKNIHSSILTHVCGECGRRFAFAEDLKNHLIYHTGERRYCDLCDKSFIYSSSLKKHKKSIHQKLRSFACELCDKRFYSGFELKRHSHSHTGMAMDGRK